VFGFLALSLTPVTLPRPVILNEASRRFFFRVRFCANASARAVKDLSGRTTKSSNDRRQSVTRESHSCEKLPKRSPLSQKVIV
jgi:hypothetical protein